MALLRSLSVIRTPFLDSFFLFVTQLSQETIVILIICIFYWCVDKRSAMVIGISYFLSGLLVQGLKITFRIERPWVIDPNFNAVSAALPASTGYSFPSGHTQSATALFGSLSTITRNRAARALCFALCLLIGFSRLYLGVHTPLDVIVGMALTFAIVLCVYFFSKKFPDNFGTALPLVFAGLATALVIYSFTLYSAGHITSEYVADCFKAGGAGLGFAFGMFIEQRYINFDVTTNRIWKQALKLVTGLAVLLALKFGLPYILGRSLVSNLICYLIIVLWAIALYPLIIKRYFAPEAK
ncbi:MAG: phosphatase PAP2 family protein [Oscillospiraceae bacterium]